MQITLDTSKMSIIIDGKAYVITDKSIDPAPTKKTIADFLKPMKVQRNGTLPSQRFRHGITDM